MVMRKVRPADARCWSRCAAGGVGMMSGWGGRKPRWVAAFTQGCVLRALASVRDVCRWRRARRGHGISRPPSSPGVNTTREMVFSEDSCSGRPMEVVTRRASMALASLMTIWTSSPCCMVNIIPELRFDSAASRICCVEDMRLIPADLNLLMMFLLRESRVLFDLPSSSVLGFFGSGAGECWKRAPRKRVASDAGVILGLNGPKTPLASRARMDGGGLGGSVPGGMTIVAFSPLFLIPVIPCAKVVISAVRTTPSRVQSIGLVSSAKLSTFIGIGGGRGPSVPGGRGVGGSGYPGPPYFATSLRTRFWIIRKRIGASGAPWNVPSFRRIQRLFSCSEGLRVV